MTFHWTIVRALELWGSGVYSRHIRLQTPRAIQIASAICRNLFFRSRAMEVIHHLFPCVPEGSGAPRSSRDGQVCTESYGQGPRSSREMDKVSLLGIDRQCNT